MGLVTFGRNAACAWRTSSAAMRSFRRACCKADTCAPARRNASSSVMAAFVCAAGAFVCGVAGDIAGDGAALAGLAAGEGDGTAKGGLANGAGVAWGDGVVAGVGVA